jgi:branched-chain amino acid transport system substrate-binding protein
MASYRTTLTIAAIATAALPAIARADYPVGNLDDFSGPTADVGKPYGQGVADAMAWINEHGGIKGTKVALDATDYGYQVPRALAAYKNWTGGNKVVAIMGWGTADTEALVKSVAQDEIPYVSASYAGTLTDPTGKGSPKSERAAPYNFFYGPSYSDAARALVQWAADDWKKKGGKGAPKIVHMGANHPYPNAPKAAEEEMAKSLGFEVLEPITFALTPGDYTAQCLTLKNSGANYAYLGNTAASNIAVLRACETAGVKVQFLGNVWGIDENALKAAGTAGNGVVFPVRTAALWGDKVPGMAAVAEMARHSDPGGAEYKPVHYLAGICATMYLKEAMEWAAANGGVTGPNVAKGFYAKADWVPKGTEGVCKPSTWTAEDHRPTLSVDLYRTEINGPTDAGSVSELMSKGVIKLSKIATIDLPRKKEWIGY